MENRKNETIIFLKRLNELQLKKLVILCGKFSKLDDFEKIESLDDINLRIYPKKEEWNYKDYVIIEAYIGRHIPLYQSYKLNDFVMSNSTGYSREKYDELLHRYLASQFGEEYTEYLFKKRVNDALKEKQMLNLSYQENKSDSGPVLCKNLKFYEDIYF